MKIGMRNSFMLMISIVIAIILVVSGCGGGDSISSSGGTSTNLKGALFSILNPVPVVSNTLLRQNAGSPINGAQVSYVVDQTGIAGFGAAKITVATATTNSNGVASIAIPAGAYTAQFSGLPTDLVAGENAAYYNSETVTASSSKNYRADQYIFSITSPVALSSLTIEVYQTNSAGVVDQGSYSNSVDPLTGNVASSIHDPIVYNKTTTLSSVTTDAEIVELFKGSYRAVIRATPVLSTDSLAVYISNVFTVTGGGVTASTPVALAAPNKAPSITLQNTSGAGLASYGVSFYEAANKIFLGTVSTNASGVASIGVSGSVTSVIATIADNTAAYKGVYVFNDINTSITATLKQFTIAGQVQPSVGSLDALDPLSVYARTNSGLGRWADNVNVASVSATPGTGVYTLTLFGGAASVLNYKIGASSVKGFPDLTKTSVAVTNASLTSQNIAVAPGGVILGKIQTEGKLDLASIRVSVYGASADGVIEEVASMQTNSTGDYSLEVPYGTYFLLANGAVSDGIGISAGAATYQKNLTQFSLLGQVSKNLGNTTAGANAASVLIGAQSATTNSLGVFTFNVMEGKNWICAVPSATNDPTYGYTCNLNVLVDASTVAAARQ